MMLTSFIPLNALPVFQTANQTVWITLVADTGLWSLTRQDLFAVGIGLGLVVLIGIISKRRSSSGLIKRALNRYVQGESDLKLLKISTGSKNHNDLSAQNRNADKKNTGSVAKVSCAWNQLISELDDLRHRSFCDQIIEKGLLGGKHHQETTLACNSLPIGMLIFDQQLTCQYANGAAERFLDADQAVSARENLKPLLEKLGLIQAAQLAITGQRAAVVNELQRSEEDARLGVMRVTIRRLPEADPTLGIILFEDITQQRVAESSRHAFIAEATHELRMPLQNIKLYVEQVLELGQSEEDQAERAECMNIINSETIRLNHMIEEVLSISAVESGALSVQHDDVRLDELIHHVSNDYRAQAEQKKLDFRVNLPPKIPVVQADREKLLLALHNVLGNAVKYTPEGGRVTLSATQTDHAINIDVADTGMGISPEEHERVFERFYRANDRRVRQITGTGLGLAISREIIRLHGGDILLHSDKDQGSTFTIHLPLPQTEKAAA